MHRYVTHYSNEVHQLVVSVSKHLFITSDGRVKYQMKPFDISLAKLSRSPKEHVVHYLIRDHFSRLFYAEIASSRRITPVEEFLQRAWSEKSLHVLCGLPDYLTVTRTVSNFFPGLVPLVLELGIEIIDATSGFQAGVRDLRTWEDHVRFQLDFKNPLFADLSKSTEHLCCDLCEGWAGAESKAERWLAGLR
jgi:hypothetical protein